MPVGQLHRDVISHDKVAFVIRIRKFWQFYIFSKSFKFICNGSLEVKNLDQDCQYYVPIIGILECYSNEVG